MRFGARWHKGVLSIHTRHSAPARQLPRIERYPCISVESQKMKMVKARVRMYHDICDTGLFEVRDGRPRLPGIPRSQKERVIEALHKLNPIDKSQGFVPDRDYPASEYNDDIVRGNVFPSNVTVAEAHFALEKSELEVSAVDWITKETYVFGRTLDNNWWHRIDGVSGPSKYRKYKKDILRICAHAESRRRHDDWSPNELLNRFAFMWDDDTVIDGSRAEVLFEWVCDLYSLIELETDYHSLWEHLQFQTVMDTVHSKALDYLHAHVPVDPPLVLDESQIDHGS